MTYTARVCICVVHRRSRGMRIVEDDEVEEEQ